MGANCALLYNPHRGARLESTIREGRSAQCAAKHQTIPKTAQVPDAQRMPLGAIHYKHMSAATPERHCRLLQHGHHRGALSRSARPSASNAAYQPAAARCPAAATAAGWAASVVGVHELLLGLLQHLQPRKQLLPARQRHRRHDVSSLAGFSHHRSPHQIWQCQLYRQLPPFYRMKFTKQNFDLSII